ncbi:uncharacterized protein LOC121856220 [Homarus americanus]|uniref:uncharacterized protein LOC121856220 n=1 Tax=Homarus americanus TaxID=6706 RepID=UPI001C47167B|nr:uncharacterized protein LOC121856220 [Homarus americanus]
MGDAPQQTPTRFLHQIPSFLKGEFLVWWFWNQSPAGATRQRKKMEDGSCLRLSDCPENFGLRHRKLQGPTTHLHGKFRLDRTDPSGLVYDSFNGETPPTRDGRDRRRHFTSCRRAYKPSVLEDLYLSALVQ